MSPIMFDSKDPLAFNQLITTGDPNLVEHSFIDECLIFLQLIQFLSDGFLPFIVTTLSIQSYSLPVVSWNLITICLLYTSDAADEG